MSCPWSYSFVWTATSPTFATSCYMIGWFNSVFIIFSGSHHILRAENTKDDRNGDNRNHFPLPGVLTMRSEPTTKINMIHEIPEPFHGSSLYSSGPVTTLATATSMWIVRIKRTFTKLDRPTDGSHHLPSVGHALIKYVAPNQVVWRRLTELLGMPIVVFWTAKGRHTWEVHCNTSEVLACYKVLCYRVRFLYYWVEYLCELLQNPGRTSWAVHTVQSREFSLILCTWSRPETSSP